MPSIEGGGVEKNLFIISNYLTSKINDISLITISNKYKKKFNKEIRIISLKSNFWNSVGRRKKFLLSLLLLIIEIFKDRNILVLCFQGNIYCTLLCRILGIKIIVRSNSAPEGWSQGIIKYYFFKTIFKFANKLLVIVTHLIRKRFKILFTWKKNLPYNKKLLLLKKKNF